jgi:hypothetical protein
MCPDCLPGFEPTRMVDLMKASIRRCGLNLTGARVLTEAASGAYASTPVIAALAGAERVYAIARDGPYGTVEAIHSEINELMRLAGVTGRIAVVEDDPAELAPDVDLVTNSGHVRPINARLIARLTGRAVITLMYEAWEFRPSDVDAAACAARNIPIVGVNERHHSVNVFSFLGPLAVRQPHDEGIPVCHSRIAVICDNPSGPFITRSLEALGAEVAMYASPADLPADGWDAVLTALGPGSEHIIDARDAVIIADRAPGAVLVQFWGDVRRDALDLLGIRVWPPEQPKPGHMGILLSAIGPDSIIRLQTGGLRAGEWVLRHGVGSCIPGGIAEPLVIDRPEVVHLAVGPSQA